MKAARIIACAVAALLALAGFSSSFSTRLDYSQQDRTHLSSPPSSAHWLGTDMLAVIGWLVYSGELQFHSLWRQRLPDFQCCWHLRWVAARDLLEEWPNVWPR